MMANNSAGLLEIEENLGKTKEVPDCPSCADCAELSVELTQVLLDCFQFLLETTAYHSLQWLTTICYTYRRVYIWLLDNIQLWVKQLLIAHK